MPDKSLFDVAYPEPLRNIETGLVKKRPKWKEADSTQQAVGVAISGGGIRSATFSLGVFQALAKLRLLRHIDYVLSVSGGGYFAGLYGRIFTREDVHNVDEVEDILSPDRAGQSWIRDPTTGETACSDGFAKTAAISHRRAAAISCSHSP